jgi:hypothetical protein
MSVLAALDRAARGLLPPAEQQQPGSEGPLSPQLRLAAGISAAKYVVSALLFAVCVVVAMSLVQSALSAILIWVFIAYLASLEGGQVALVSLGAVAARSSYSASHKVTSKCMALVEKQGATERYIMGRQFLVVIVIFLINIFASGSATCDKAALGALGEGLCATGLTLTFVTIMVAQIASQIVASCCRLDFINNHLMWVNIRLALGVECSGILHAVHLVRILLARVFGEAGDSAGGAGKETDVFTLANNTASFFWARVLLSLFLLWFAICAIFHEILLGHTDSLGSAPGFVNMLIVFLFMAVVGMYEGLQIALVALAHVDVGALRERSPAAAANCQLTFGPHLESFLIGRQMFVTVFVVSLPTLHV